MTPGRTPVGAEAIDMAIRAVIFDLFDTLVDLEYDHVARERLAGRPVPPTARLLHAAVSDHVQIDFEAFLEISSGVDRELFGKRYAEDLEVPTLERFTALIDRLGLDAPELPTRLTELHMGALREQTAVPSHHEAFLAGLSERVRVGLCSNFSHSETARSLLAAAGFERHLDAIVISDAVGVRKPHPKIFLETLAQLGVGPDEALHVGDNLHADVRGAAGAGIRSVWITRRVPDVAQLLEAYDGPPPDHVIADLPELFSILDRRGS
jgi:FMN phosphatase YigB (HAD superfamily)